MHKRFLKVNIALLAFFAVFYSEMDVMVISAAGCYFDSKKNNTPDFIILRF